MKLGTVIRNDALRTDSRFLNLVSQLRRESYELYDINSKADIQPGTDLVLSIGGDGTFILAAQLVADVGLPILGVEGWDSSLKTVSIQSFRRCSAEISPWNTGPC